MSAIMIVVSLICAGLGALMLSNATMGVGVICAGCLAAILARIAQAESHFRKTQAKSKALSSEGPPTP